MATQNDDAEQMRSSQPLHFLFLNSQFNFSILFFRLVEEAVKNVKQQAFFMKRAMVNGTSFIFFSIPSNS